MRSVSSILYCGCAAALLMISAPRAQADDSLFGLGLYVGAAAGSSRVEASPRPLVNSVVGEPSLIDGSNFDAVHSAYKVMAGLRPISMLGAEVSYMDFGHPNGNLGVSPANVDLKGAAAFAVAYLPVPIVDVMVKVGLARLQDTLAGYGSFHDVGSDGVYHSLFRLDRTNTNFAVGGAVQYSLGPVALRAEYERFEAADTSPTLLTAGVTWTF